MKTKNKELLRCPNGETTYSLTKYRKAWADLYNVIEDEFDVKCSGYDRGIAFYDKNNHDLSVDLPLWFVMRIVQKVGEIKEREREYYDASIAGEDY